MEDARSAHPSTTLSTYLIVSLVFDAANAWTLRHQHVEQYHVATRAVNEFLKVVMLLLECQSKTRYLTQPRHLSPEITSGLVSQSSLWWMNSLFLKGIRSTLTIGDLFPLDGQLASANLSIEIREAWAQRREPERRFEFALAAWRVLRWHILSAAIPRVFLITFNFAQPFLIAQVLHALTQPDSPVNRDAGHALIFAAFFVYSGKSFSTLYYNQGVSRMMTMFRGASVSLIYNHLLTLPLGECDDSSVVTLMSTDVDGLVLCLTSVNEVWAHLIEVVLGVVLLSRQLGWVSIVPIIVVIGESGARSPAVMRAIFCILDANGWE